MVITFLHMRIGAQKNCFQYSVIFYRFDACKPRMVLELLKRQWLSIIIAVPSHRKLVTFAPALRETKFPINSMSWICLAILTPLTACMSKVRGQRSSKYIIMLTMSTWKDRWTFQYV